MKLSIILSQLSTGMAGTISIFVLTLVFSLPLGLLIAFGRMSKNRNFPALYLPDARHASDAAAHGGLLRTVLSVRYEHRKMALSGDYHRICLKLRRLFCRNLPLRHRFDGSWTVRGSKASWLFEGTDVCPHYSAAGCETDSAGDHQ